MSPDPDVNPLDAAVAATKQTTTGRLPPPSTVRRMSGCVAQSPTFGSRTLDQIGSDITVEFIGPPRVPDIAHQEADVVAEYKRDLDALGQAVWIVSNKDGPDESAYHVLASSQCLFGEKEGAVVNPG